MYVNNLVGVEGVAPEQQVIDISNKYTEQFIVNGRIILVLNHKTEENSHVSIHPYFRNFHIIRPHHSKPVNILFIIIPTGSIILTGIRVYI